MKNVPCIILLAIAMLFTGFALVARASTITTINGSDTLSGSRSTINTNFSNLNTDKLEMAALAATTSLPNITSLTNLGTLKTSLSGLISALAGVLYSSATTSVTCTGSTSCTTFAVLGGTPITISSTGGFSYTPGSNFGTNVNSTSTPISYVNGLMASTTSYFANLWASVSATSTIGNLSGVLDASMFPGVDMGAKINAAYAALPSAGGKITVPCGRYSFTTPIVFGTNNKVVVLTGCGHGGPTGPYPLQVGGTTLNYTPSTGTAVTVDTNYSQAQSVIEHISIQGPNGTTAATNKGVVFGGTNGAFGGTLSDTHVAGFGTGVQYNSYTSFTLIDRSVIDFNGRNIDEPDTAGANCENMRISNSVIADANNQAGGATDLYGFAVQESGNCQWNIVNTSIDDNSVYINQFGGTANVWTFTNVHWENPNGHTYPYIDTLTNVPATEVTLIGGDMMNDVVAGMPYYITSGGDTMLIGVSIDSNSNVTTPVTAVVNLENSSNNATVTWVGLVGNGKGAKYVYGKVPFSPQGYGTGFGEPSFYMGSTTTARLGPVGVGTSSPAAKFSIQANSLTDNWPSLFMIGSSTATATTTLFSVANTGLAYIKNLLTATTATSTIGNLGGVLDASAFSGSDMGAQINAAYAALPSSGGKITVPCGRYSYTTPIVFGTNDKVVILSGCGHGGPTGPYPQQVGGTTLNYTPSTGTAVTVDTNYSQAQSVIEHISIQGPNGTTAATNKGVVFGGTNGAFGGTLSDAHVSGFGTGVQYNSYTSFTLINKSVIDFNGRNIDEPDTAGANCENMRISDSVIADANNQAGGATDLYGFTVQESGNCQWNIVNTSIDDNSVYINQFGGTANVWTFTNVHWENPNGHTYPYIDTLTNVPATEVTLIGGDMMNDVVAGMPYYITSGGDTNLIGVSIDSNNNVTTPVTAIVSLENSSNNATVTWVGLVGNGAGAKYVYSKVPFSPQGFGTGFGEPSFYVASTTSVRLGGVGIGTSSPGAKFSIQANALTDNWGSLFMIGSSTRTASTTLFSVSNTGSTTASNGFNITAGCFAVNGTCLAAGGSGTVTSVATNNGITGGTITTTGTIGLDVINAGVLGAQANSTVPTSQATSTLYGNATGGQVLAWSNGGLKFVSTTTAGMVTSVSGTTNQITSSGGFTPTLSLPSFVLFPGSASSTSFSVLNGFFAGATATTSIDAAGNTTIGGWFKMPLSTDPTVDLSAKIAINSTAASTSIRFHDGTAERALYVEQERALPQVASTTLRVLGSFGTSGTTTLLMANYLRPVTLLHAYCKTTDGNSAYINFGRGDGTASTTAMLCNSSGALTSFAANNTWAALADFRVGFGNSSATAPSGITITLGIREDAD